MSESETNTSPKEPKEEPIESKLIPILREGINIIKMIFFKELKDHFIAKYNDRDGAFVSRLTGAVMNELFGTPNLEEPFASFGRDNRKLIEEELGALADELEKMRIPTTDTLRTGFLCDSQEGIGDDSVLKRAEEWGFLIKDRDLPMPNSFLDMVHRMGAAYGLIVPPQPAPTSEPSTSIQ